MTTEITMPTKKEEKDVEFAPQFHAVAVNGTEMVQAKAGIQSWLERKLKSIEEEIVSLQAVHDSAVKHKWKSSTFKGQLEREKRKHLYYGKLLTACNAGFTIVPNMPCDTFAIRVKRDEPKFQYGHGTSNYSYRSASPSVPDEKEDRLPVGEGEYQNPEPKFSETEYKDKTVKDGKEIEVYAVEQIGLGFAEIEFPLAVAHPMVMDATARAMAMKIFDRIAIVPQTRRRGYRGDPIVLGQITMKDGYSTKTASFLIAWYLDPRTL